jgi:hypothetical protein
MVGGAVFMFIISLHIYSLYLYTHTEQKHVCILYLATSKSTHTHGRPLLNEKRIDETRKKTKKNLINQSY